ncbi:MAG: carboxymuconolactone decarboxylase family protein [Ectothiorhodospiraceae bacterium]|nr:carboxymuconolactone decarboxylase family protein [Ectothiorhodospiraceae bacterium]
MNDTFDDNEAFRRGLALRREVLGEAHVERSLDRAREDPFLRVMQQLTTEFGWGTVWSRPGLPRKTRSFLAMAFLAANGKHDELRTHVRGAVRNGATRDEIAEVLLQAAVYCGFPVGLESFRIAKAVLDEMDAAGEGPVAGGAAQ